MAVFMLQDFSGGLNTRLAPNLIADNESPAMRNVFWRDVGALTKRRGIIKQDTVTLVSTATMYMFIEKALPKPAAVVDDGMDPRIYRIQHKVGTGTGTSSLVESTNAADLGAAGTGGGNITSPHIGTRPVAFAGKIYVVTGSNLYQWDGTTLTTISGIDANSYGWLIPHKNYLFACGSDADGKRARLSWSSLRDATIWPASNNVQVGTDDGHNLVCGIPFQDALVLFKSGRRLSASSKQGSMPTSGMSIWQLFGDIFDPTQVTYELRRLSLSDIISTMHPYTMTIWNEFLTFLAPDGLYGFDGSTANKFTDKIQPTVDTWYKGFGSVGNLTSTTIDPRPAEPSSAVYKSCLYLNLLEDRSDPPTPTTTGGFYTPNAMYVFTPEGPIWRWTHGINIQHIYIDNSQNLRGICGQPGAANTQLSRVYFDQSSRIDQDNTSIYVIDAMWTSKEFDFKAQQMFKHAYIHMRGQLNGILVFEYSIDGSRFVPVQVPMTYRGSTGIVRSNRILLGKKGRTMQFRISNAEPYVNFEIYGIEVHYDPGGTLN